MADDKSGREKQARDADRRQRERDIAAELKRGAEPEPPMDAADLADLEIGLETESLRFPATGAEIVAAVGGQEVGAETRSHTVEELIPETDAEAFGSPAAVRERVQRPTVAAAMKRIVEAIDGLEHAELRETQRDAYERTLLELKAIDADDDDAGIEVIVEWILDRVRDDGKVPGSRDVRRRAAKFCRANGYQVRDDEWLGV
jgi:hypothetical protein